MKFDVDDKNRCRLVCVKFHLHRCRFAVAVAKCLGGSLFWDTVYITSSATLAPHHLLLFSYDVFFRFSVLHTSAFPDLISCFISGMKNCGIVHSATGCRVSHSMMNERFINNSR